MLTQRDDENNVQFTIRRIRAEHLEEAASIVLAEAVTPGDPADATDISYNIALDHAAAALRRAAQS
jgi:hypothetical protein